MPPKNFQLTFAWMLLATILMGAAVWQAQVTVAREAAAKHATLPPPPKTRHAVRPPPSVFSGNAADDYIARCEKGMTLQEIRWALTDFENAGLATKRPEPGSPPAEVLAFRTRQGLWYLQCLTEGLYLDQEQKSQASAAMAKLFQEEHDSRLELLQKQKQPDPGQTSDRTSLHDEVDRNWSESHNQDPFTPGIPSPYMPWNLCRLTDSQTKVTWKHWHELAFSKEASPNAIDAILDRPEISDPEKLAETTGGPVFLLPEPLSSAMTVGDAPDRIADWLFAANHVYPLLARQQVGLFRPDTRAQPDQKSDQQTQSEFLRMIQRLHPVQLKTALLLQNGMEEEVRAELTRTGN